MHIKLLNVLFSFLFSLAPNTRAYGFKRNCLRLRGFTIAKNVRIVSSVKFHIPAISIGENKFIGHETMFVGGDAKIKIGKNVDIAPRLLIATGSHNIGSTLQRAGEGHSSDVSIGDGTWIGANCTILGGVNIGRGYIIAAGSLVKESCPDNCLIAGVPGSIKKLLDIG